ncbi:helix-turn-helix domain-containing protein [Aquimarina algiphila]|uniref:helix-turn-helix domain-containing protein n=1 Tax=Aquimarina algiphila TaxID=2047982 RepID=UPI00232BD028|nr:AraC family transcriptional regulator [Aquimarina algiphila]
MCGRKISLKHPLFITTAMVIGYNLFLLFNFLELDSLSKDHYIKAIVSQELPLPITITTTLFIALQQIYFTIAAYRVYKFQKKVSNIFSTRSNIKIVFTKRFIVLIWILNTTTFIAYAVASVHLVEFVIMPLVLSMIISSIVYYAFEHKAIFNEKTYEIFKKDIKLISQTSLVFQSNIDSDSNLKTVLHAKVIEDFLRESKSYLKLEYTIVDLSKDLGFPHAEVSSVINNELHKNFSKLINDFRVEESKLILKEKFNKINIESIAELSGFKSRASFYRAFKNKMGITPSEYVKQLFS